ncbi:MAG: class III extradiol ring-cleavage dioxygenase [Candidatus Saccharimonadales bacterium]
MTDIKKLSELLLPSEQMPVLFVGHGNPMNAILDNPITQKWADVGNTMPAYQAIVVISAHWLTSGTHITDAPKQPIIYDMYGFPPELYETKYDANGDPTLAELLRQQLLKYEAALDSSWGLDHGTWSVLKHLAPHPSVPVLQISLDYSQSLEQVVELFKELKALRKKGVLFIGSGNIVHNLRAVNFQTNKAYDWAIEFDELSAKAIEDKNIKLLTKPGKISSAASFAVPTDDHYRPMLAIMSLLEDNEQLDFFNTDIDLGSVSMRSFVTV